MNPVYICSTCGSSNIHYDAYVAVNDKSQVHTFDTVDCGDCGGKDIGVDVIDRVELDVI